MIRIITYCMVYIYSGWDSNFDLCTSQRTGDYDKWKWFDKCLHKAIVGLSHVEQGRFSVYSGLSGVKMDQKVVSRGYFVTYVSTSWKKEVSEKFTGGKEGMMICFDENFKDYFGIYCCDVSWISKFPDECEVLFARSVDAYDNFKCVVVDEKDGIQTVLLKKNN